MRRHARLACALTAAAVVIGAGTAWAANDPGFPRQWNMPLIGADSAWSVGTGQGITIAVVDSGVHLSQEDLTARLVPGRNFVTPNAQPQDDNGHGTHVAGIAAASLNNGRGVVGVAPSARIMPVKVLDRDGEGTYSNAAAGIRWAVDNGAHVVNLSLGSTVATLTGSPSVFVEAIGYAWSKGVICVVAAGNDFVLSSDFAAQDAVVVSATTRNDSAALYSNGVGEAKWGLAAPGGAGTLSASDDIFSTYWTSTNKPNEYQYLAGTSMAAPHVAGALAVLRSLGLSPAKAIERLRTTAKDLGAAGRDNVYGDGRIDMAKATAGLGPSGTAGAAGTGGSGTSGSSGTSGTTATTANGTSGTRGATATTAKSPTTPTGGGALGGTNLAPSTDGSAPATGDDRISVGDFPATDSLDAEEAAGQAQPAGDPGGTDDDTVWLAGLLAVAALVAVTAGAARARRLRV
jgi:serine protease